MTHFTHLQFPASSLAKLAKKETQKERKVRPWFGRHPSASLGWMELCGHLKPHPLNYYSYGPGLWQCGEVPHWYLRTYRLVSCLQTLEGICFFCTFLSYSDYIASHRHDTLFFSV
jgi:hypothetical protein